MESSQNLLTKGKKSSRILKMSYIKSKKLLTITFNSGATYEYYDKNIKGIYNYRRVVNG